MLLPLLEVLLSGIRVVLFHKTIDRRQKEIENFHINSILVKRTEAS